jgi:acyl carrier protein
MSQLGEHCTTERTPLERVIALVRQILGPPTSSRPLPIDARFSELGMSSIKMVQLMLGLEVEFGLMIPQHEITLDNFASIASVESLLTRLLGPAGSH